MKNDHEYDEYGYVKIPKCIVNGTLWDDKPFTVAQAWIDLLLTANQSVGLAMCKGRPVNIKRGQLFTTTRKLQDKWGWGNTKVVHILKAFGSAGLITVERKNTGTLITVLDYEQLTIDAESS